MAQWLAGRKEQVGEWRKSSKVGVIGVMRPTTVSTISRHDKAAKVSPAWPRDDAIFLAMKGEEDRLSVFLWHANIPLEGLSIGIEQTRPEVRCR